MNTTGPTTDYHTLQSRLTDIEQILQQMVFLDRCTNSQELGVAIQALLHVLGDYTRAERAFIFDFDEEKQLFYNTFEWCAEGITPFIDMLQAVPPTNMPYWTAAFSRGESILIKDLEEVRETMPLEYDILKLQHIHSEISFPLIYRDNFRGFIGLDNPEMERTEPILHLLNVVGRTLCGARENIRKDILLEENQSSIDNYVQALEQERSVLSVLCKDYTSVYDVDLRSQTVRILKMDPAANIAPQLAENRQQTYNYMQLMKLYYDNFVLPGSAPDFAERLQPERLMQVLDRKGRYTYHYRTIPNAIGREYFELLASPLKKTEDSYRVIMGFRHIDEIVKEEQKQQRKLQEALDAATLNNEIISAISKIYFSIYRIDLVNDIYEEVASENELHRLTGHTGKAATLMQELCQSFVTPEYQPQVMQFLDLTTLPGRLRRDETLAIEYHAQDGNWHFARFIVKRRDEDGEVTNVLYVTRLISDQKRRERNYISAAQEAKRASQAKSDFLSRMAHDIRTPLNAIMGFRDIASQCLSDPTKVSDCLKRIDVAGAYLQQLVNDVLDIAAIEGNHLQLQAAPVELSVICNTLQSIFSYMAEQKQIDLRFQKHDILCSSLITDELRLKQVYANLLSNAIKYTPDGGKVSFELYEQPAAFPDHIQLIAVIRDTGVGIQPDYLNKMYDKFSRGIDTRVNKVRGSGLGLSIVREIIEQMHGHIDVQSEVGKGTTFTVTLDLPCQRLTPTQPVADVLASGTENCAGIHLLIAEDNDLNYDVISELLQMHQIQCDRAENGALCVDIFQNAPEGTYDAILMDMQMPVMDGLEATRAIRALSHPQAASIPILAITANAFAQDIDKCTAAGMNGHLSKPIHIHQLLAVLSGLVQPKV